MDVPAVEQDRTTAGRHLRTAVRAVGEVAIATTLYLLYRAGRLAIAGHESVATANARRVHHLEGWLHLPSEVTVQEALSNDLLYRAANWYYTSVHFPAIIAFLVLGFALRPRADYIWARNLLVVQTALALAIHALFPLSPPRMFPQWGFVDTMTTLGPSAYDGAGASVANQFAAMPSLHIGWAVLIAFVISRTGPRWLTIVATLHAMLTTIVVIVTANHWFIDGIVAVVLLAVAVAVLPRPGTRRRLRSRAGSTPAG